MAGQSGMPTPIFDELLREMTSRDNDPSPPARTNTPPANPAPEQNQNRAAGGTRRRHRAD